MSNCTIVVNGNAAGLIKKKIYYFFLILILDQTQHNLTHTFIFNVSVHFYIFGCEMNIQDYINKKKHLED